jgi:hypothetical protein
MEFVKHALISSTILPLIFFDKHTNFISAAMTLNLSLVFIAQVSLANVLCCLVHVLACISNGHLI